MHPTAVCSGFAEDVRDGLLAAPKRLDPRYFYDALGSQLFEAICRLPWYTTTRAENALLAQHAAEMVAETGDAATLVELGCGCGEKLARLCEPLRVRGARLRVHLIDVSEAALELSARTLSALGPIELTGHRTTYEQGIAQATARRASGERMLVLFLGSNIGNLDDPQAVALLTTLRRALRTGDALLLGADLVKPEADLVHAYDDPLGVTAAFNKNLLVRINRELGADFDLSTFAHEARWNAAASRVEMHLVSRRPQEVRVPGAGVTVAFAEGESIWTESSYKYSPDGIGALVAAQGFTVLRQWVDADAQYALTLFRAV